MPHDRFVLDLLCLEMRNAWRSARISDLAWIVLGGGFLSIYAIADVAIVLRQRAAILRDQPALWALALALIMLTIGAVSGALVARLTAARARAPFLKALPLSMASRRRMAIVAALVIGAPVCATAGVFVGLACWTVGNAGPPLWGGGAACIFGLGFSASLLLRLQTMFQEERDVWAQVHGTGVSLYLPGIDRLDRTKPAWLGSWAWKLSAGRMRVTPVLLASAAMLGGICILSSIASLARHQAAPAAIAGIICGLLAFMLSLRCHPLHSPVLRASPLAFTRVWLRLLRLPLMLSAVFFALPAGVALAAEPSSWMISVGGGAGLLTLNFVYAVFAAYFMTAPLVAAISFFAALAYADYESLEYGRTVLLALAALVMLLWYRARRRYYHG